MGPTRRELFAAALLGATLGAAVILVNSGGDVEKMTFSDGAIAQYVAAHLDTPSSKIHPVVSSRGTSLRYGRIGLPLAIWIASAGRPAAMKYVQPLIMVICAAAAAAAARALFPRAPPFAALTPFVAIGSLLAISGGFADALGISAGLWAVVAALRERWWASAGLLALAMLARENAGAVLLGLIVGMRLWRRRRELAIILSSLVPILGWYLFVRARYGSIPILDPYLRVKTSTIETPGIAIWHSLTKTHGSSFAMAVIMLVIAIAAITLWKTSVLGAVAAAAGIQILSAGPFSFKFIGEAARTGSFVQLFLVLALVALRWPVTGSDQVAT